MDLGFRVQGFFEFRVRGLGVQGLGLWAASPEPQTQDDLW